jgi:hypothetical protein
MKRREFAGKVVHTVVTAAVAAPPAAVSAQSPRKPRRNTLMHVGGDYHSVVGPGITSKENLEYNLRHGVRHLTALVRQRSLTEIGKPLVRPVRLEKV